MLSLPLKKSLLVGGFLPHDSLPDRPVGPPLVSAAARRGRSRRRGDGLRRPAIRDSGRDLLAVRELGRGRFRHGSARDSSHSPAPGSGSGPGAKRRAGGAIALESLRQLRADGRLELRELEGPGARARRHVQVPSRAMRAGHAFAAIAAPTAAGHAATTSPRPACGPKRASSCADLVADAFHFMPPSPRSTSPSRRTATTSAGRPPPPESAQRSWLSPPLWRPAGSPREQRSHGAPRRAR